MKNLRYFIALFSCMAFNAHSQTLSWSGFPAGGTSYTTGIMTATITSSSPGFQNGAPKHYAGSTVGGGECGIAGGLALEHMFGNITNAHSTLTMDYTSGNATNGLCGNISFQVKDINADETYQTFADWVEVSAIDGNNNPIPVANITATGGSNKTITTSGNTRIVKGHSNNSYGSRSATICDNVTFTVTPPAGTTLKSVTLKYHPDYTPSPSDYYNFTGPKRPAYQYISISAVTVTAAAGPTAVVLNTTPASCSINDGTVTIGAVTGGTSPYQFNFNSLGLGSTTNFANLAAGSYPVIVQDNNGCTFSTSALVNLATGPTTIATTPINASCGQSNGSVSLGAVSGGSAPYTYNFNNTGFGTATNFPNLASGTYPLVVQDDNGCTFNTTVTVNTSAGPTAIAATPINASCGQSNGSVSLGAVTGGSSPYAFNFNNTGFGTATNFPNLASGTYPLVVQDDNGCTFNTTVTVNASNGPTAIATSPSDASCGLNNGTVTLGAVTGGTSPYTYNFNGSGFSSSTSYNNLAPGTYPLVVQDDNGCTFNTSTVVGDAGNGPTAFASNVISASCGISNGEVTLLTVIGGTDPYTYNFNGTGFSSNTTFSNLAAGTYQLIVQDNNGCTFTGQVNVTSSSGPTGIVTTPSNTTCGQGNGSVSLGAVTGGIAPYEYNFNNTGFGTATTFANLASGTYPLIVEDASGCIFNTTVEINASSGPTGIATTPVSAFCGQNNGAITLGSVIGGTGPYQFNFNSQGFASTTSFSSLGAGGYPLVIEDNNGCTFNTLVTVPSVMGPSWITVQMVNGTCGPNSSSVEIQSTAGGTPPYLYNFNGQGYSSNMIFNNLADGVYYISVQDANGCIHTTTLGVTAIGTGPSAVASTIADASCADNNGSVSFGTVTDGAAPYEFNFNGTGFSTSTVFNNLGAGTYPVIVQDANGCTYATQVTVSSSNGPTAVVLNTIADACLQGIGSVNLGAITGGTAPYEYNFNGLGFSTNSNYSNLAAGTYSVIIRDALGCTFATSAVVGGAPGPTNISINMSTASCGLGNGSVTLGTVTGGTAPYTYNFNNLGFSSNTSYTILPAGNYPLIVSDANGCQYTTSVLVSSLNSGPFDVLYNTQPSACGSGGTFEIVNVSGGTAPYTYALNNVIYNAPATDVAPGSYDLVVTDANGCFYSEVILIGEGTGLESLKIPNVFTPNGDPANATWFIEGSCIRSLECVIVNRWGDVLETFDEATDQWDGTFASKKVAEGTYFYKATITFWSGTTKDYHGNITVIH